MNEKEMLRLLLDKSNADLEATIADWEAAMRMQHEAGQDLIRLQTLLSRVLIEIDAGTIYHSDDLLKEVRDAVGPQEGMMTEQSIISGCSFFVGTFNGKPLNDVPRHLENGNVAFPAGWNDEQAAQWRKKHNISGREWADEGVI